MGFHWVFLDFTGFYWFFPGLSVTKLGFYWVSLGFTRFYWVLFGFTGFYCLFPGLSWKKLGFYWVFTRFYPVWLDFIRFYWVLLGFIRFLLNFTGFHCPFPGLCRICTRFFFPQVLPSFSKDIIDEYLDMTSGWISMDLIGFWAPSRGRIWSDLIGFQSSLTEKKINYR